MPIATAFTPDGAGLLRTAQGQVTGAELIAADIPLLSDPATIARLRYVLLDFGDATDLQATKEEARSIANQDAEFASVNPQISIAIVAPRDVQFGMSRMWQVFVADTGWETAVFRDRPAAVAWLRGRVPGLAL